MLPDCPKLKRELWDRLEYTFRQTINSSLGIIGEVPRAVIHEGRRTTMIRESGVAEETPMFRASTALEIKASEVPTITIATLVGRVQRAAEHIAEQVQSGGLQSISDACDIVGNVVDAEGAPFSADLYLKTLEKLQFDFDSEGKALLPTLVVPESKRAQAQNALESLKTDPEMSARFSRLVSAKKEEWLAREASRKLVG